MSDYILTDKELKWIIEMSGCKMVGRYVVVLPNGNSNKIERLTDNKVNYPFILQKAIEGVNEKFVGKYEIIQRWGEILVNYNNELLHSLYLWPKNNVNDIAKQDILRIVYNHMRGNNE